MAKSPAKLNPTDDGYTLEGVIDHASVPALFKQSLSSKGQTVVLNVAAVRKADSAGVALLLHWSQSLSKQGKQLLVQQADPQLIQMTDILAVRSQLHFG